MCVGGSKKPTRSICLMFQAIFILYLKNAKPISRKAAAILRKTPFNTSRIWPVNFSSLSSYSNNIHPSASYLPLFGELRFHDSSTSTAMATPGHGCAQE